MKVSELKNYLDQLDLQPSRKLGQNFLVDENTSKWIAGRLGAGPETIVVEVGPGFGALTAHLAGKVGKLILVEKDGRLAGFLSDRYRSERVEVRHEDATRFDVRTLFPGGPVRFLGNLPYSTGSEIMRIFLDAPTPVEHAVVMLQKEVADRLCAVPRTKSYGMISVVMQSRWKIETIRTVGPHLFHPRPEVDSSIIQLTPRGEDELPRYSPETFVRVVKQGFSQRRKQLHNNLPVDRDEWSGICRDLGLSESVRAEELSLEEWVNLSNRIEPHPCHDLPPSSGEPLDYVDENDQVLGQMTRREIHEKGVMHRAVHVFVFNRVGELYLQLRSRFKDTHAGKWDSSASGHVDPGEDYEECGKRELEEELGVKAKGELERILRLEAGCETDQEFVEVFRAEVKGRIRVHTSEIHSGRFFPIDVIDEWIKRRPGDFATGFKTCYRAWKAQR